MDIKKREEKIIKDINDILSTVNIDQIKNDGIMVRSGDKILKMSVVEDYSVSSIEDDIRNELKSKLQERLLSISNAVKSKITEMSDYVNKIKYEIEDKSHELEKKLKNANVMPEITKSHARQGLSITKSDDGGLLWIFQSVYWPKYIDDKVIEPSYSRRMVTHILITIETHDDNVLNVGVNKPIGFSRFEHYHTNCWGTWKFKRKWKTPDDIIEIAKEAEIVLETINTGSLANHSPVGLMRVATIEKHAKPRTPNATSDFTSSKRSENMGIDNNFTRDNIWSTI